MRKTARIWMVIAAVLVLVGAVVFGGVMTVLKWDFTKLSTIKYETNEYAIAEEYRDIAIVTNTADVIFVPSENEESTVVCHEQKNVKHTVSVENGTLTIKVVDKRKWYEHIGINFDQSKITVSIPQGEYGDLSVKLSTGDVDIAKQFRFESIEAAGNTGDISTCASAAQTIRIKTDTGAVSVKNVSAAKLELSVSTGKVTVSNVSCEGDVKIRVSTGKANITDTLCQSMTSTGSTGDICLKNVTAAQTISIERDTGDVEFDRCDAAGISVQTDTGDVTGTLRSEKVFIAETSTGKVRVPKTTSGGKCEISTDTGDIDIGIQP